MSEPDLTRSIDEAVRSLVAHAGQLREGDGENHVRTSARELEAACSRGTGIRAAVDRLSSSIHQLQGELAEGRRRQERHDAPGIERLLEVLQEDLLPALRQSGVI
jgi:hypothetical protein